MNRRCPDDPVHVNIVCRVYTHIIWGGHKDRAFLNAPDTDGALVESVGRIKGAASQPKDM